MNFKNEYLERQNKIITKLDAYLDMDKFPHLLYSKQIIDIMRYSVFSGGKRLRPVLLISAHHMVGGDIDESLPLACAIEMIHTYSLIHDDLPAMDNDDYRRGKPTTHIMFGEDMAILAGDALLNMAYEIMIENACRHPHNIRNHMKAINIIAKSSGVNGMISGQVADIAYQDQNIEAETLEFIHSYKTGAIIKASVLSGIVLEDIDNNILKAMNIYGENIGLAFQITDDILDITGNFEDLGKKVGSDQINKKNTYPLLYGLDKSKKHVEDLIAEAIEVLAPFGEKSEFLKQLALNIIERQS